MRKKSWGRLGAAIGSVALLAGGLVGVAAPAQAELVMVKSEYNKKTYLTTYGADGIVPRPYSLFWTKEEFWTERPSNDCVEAAKLAVPQFNSGDAEYKFSRVEVPSGSTDPDICGTVWEKVENKTDEEKCEDPGRDGGPGLWDEIDGKCFHPAPLFPETNVCLDGQKPIDGKCVDDGLVPPNIDCDWDAGEEYVTGEGCVKPPAPIVNEPVQLPPPPPPCWDASINNCPVGGALRFTAPKYAMVGVPVTMYAYASWRPDANAPSQPTNGTAVIRVDGEDYSGVEFKDGIAEWRFIPETEGMKEFTASGVLFSGLSGANAYIDTVPARTYVLEYDPEAYEAALKNKRVEVGDTYVITDPNQARSYLEDRYEWSVSEKSDDVCAVYETKKGAVKAKFNGEGKCTVIWMDKESEEEGKYTFIAKK